MSIQSHGASAALAQPAQDQEEENLAEWDLDVSIVDPAPCLGQRGGSGGGYRQPVQARDHLRPRLPIPQLGEQPGGQLQVDHDPRRAQPVLAHCDS